MGCVAIWVFRFCHNLSFWALSQFEFLSFVIIWVFEFSHNLGLATISVFWLSYFQIKLCHNLSSWVITIWVFKTAILHVCYIPDGGPPVGLWGLSCVFTISFSKHTFASIYICFFTIPDGPGTLIKVSFNVGTKYYITFFN